MLVGRRRELATCEGALTEALMGRGRLLVLEGEAGIGKTSVARAVAETARAGGAVVRWGACWEGDPGPFGVWLDALRWPGDDSCAAVIPRFQDGSHDVFDEAGAARARRRLFDDVAEALRRDSAEVAQLLVLEDVHWADRGSFELIRALAPRLPVMSVLVLATYRPEELSSPEAPLGTGGSAQRLAIGGLELPDVATLLEDMLGRTPSDEETEVVHTRTGGNPLFVAEVGRLAASGSIAVVPRGVGEIVRRRMARLSAGCDRVLGVASVLGTEFGVASVAAVDESSSEDVESLLAEAEVARLVEPDPGMPGRRRFAHDLVRVARYEALGSTARAEFHRRALDVLEAANAPPGVLHHHAARSHFEPGDERPARLALGAGLEALDRFAWDDAARLCEVALDGAPAGPPGDAIRVEAWLGLGAARLRGGGDARAAFDAAASLGRGLDRPDLIARAALGLGAGLVGFEVKLLDRRQVELLEEAAVVLPDESPLRPMVLARLSVALSFLGSPEERRTLAEEAVDLARRLGDDDALMGALAARCDAMAGPDHVADRTEMSAEITGLAQRTGNLRLELLGRRLRVVTLLEQRDLAAFDAEVSAYARVAEHLGDPLYSWWVPLWRAARAHADGRFDESAALRGQAREVGASGGSRNADLLCLVGEMFQALDRKRRDESDSVWGQLVERHPDLFQQEEAIAGTRSLIAALEGDEARCRAVLSASGSEALDRLPRDQEWLTAVAQFLVAAVFVENEPMVRRCYELLLPYGGLGVCEGAAAVDRGGVDRFLAVAAAHLGDRAATRAHADAALIVNAEAGALVLAQTRADVAQALLLGDPEDVLRARVVAAEAAEGFARLGLDEDARRLGLLGEAQTRPQRSSDHPGGSLVREGDAWAVTFDGSTVRIKHAKGVADLAILLSRPGQEVHVRTLEGVDHIELPNTSDPVLDEAAIDDYRRRLADLERELDEAESAADLGRAERLAVERDALVGELTKAFGLGGRARKLGSDPDERLRKAVSARIRASIGRIEEMHPTLARHLRTSVHTGYRCRYDPETPVIWHVEGDRRT